VVGCYVLLRWKNVMGPNGLFLLGLFLELFFKTTDPSSLGKFPLKWVLFTMK
jgi:hypothetical protein